MLEDEARDALDIVQGELRQSNAGLLTARGLHPVNRLHFVLGILSYASSPLWLATSGTFRMPTRESSPAG